MFKTFGNQKAVFVNQDEGMFVAMPVTFDSTVLTLETKTVGGRTIVLAGSLVARSGVNIGITAEEYDITDGPVTGRVVLEGYAWKHRLTAAAVSAAAGFPRIVLMPYLYLEYSLVGVDTDAHKATIKVVGGKFLSTISASNLTVTTLTASAVALNDAADELTITFSAGGTGEITAIAGAAVAGEENATVVGLPISVTV